MIVPVGRFAQICGGGGGGNYKSADPSATPFPYAAPAAVIVLSLSEALAVTRIKVSKPRKRNQWWGEEVSGSDKPHMLTETASEGENGDMEG